MISQLSVFLANERGRLAAACRALADAGFNMHSLVLADTADFGVARIFCDRPEEAAALLAETGYRAAVTPVIAVRVPNAPGGLATLLEFCDGAGMNVEYGYCYSVGPPTAVDVLKIEGEGAEAKLAEGGFDLVEADEIYAA